MPTSSSPLRHGDVVRIRGERWRIVRQVAHGETAVFEVAGCGTANRTNRAHFLWPFEPIDRIPRQSAPRVVGVNRWRHVARHALATACPSWTSLRAAADAQLTLVPFQLEPALALARGDGCRFLIADAVGLGKTVQAGLMIAETLRRWPDGRVLVIAPAGLREQWLDELGKRFGLRAGVLDAAGVARLAAALPPDVSPWSAQPLAIVSIDYVKRPEVMRGLEALVWDLVVLDEAHNLAGRTDRAAAAALLADRARILVLLSATPHWGDDRAFARLCGLGAAGGQEPLVTFRRTRSDAGLARACRAPLLRVRPTAAEAAMHEAVTAYARLLWGTSLAGARLVASVLARRACSSAKSLARSVERRLSLIADGGARGAVQHALPFDCSAGDDEPDAALGALGLRNPIDECRHLEHLLQLAHDAARRESKVAFIGRLLSRTDEPAVVFTEYRDTLAQLATALGDTEIVQLHGGLAPRERAVALRAFTEGGARVLLATDAGSEGLNLHHRCRLVINLEIPWNPLRLEQRAGRVDRIGQTRRVHAIHLVAAATCEESTLARLARRVQRMSGATSIFSQHPDQQRVEESVLGRLPLPDVPPKAAAIPPGVVTPDLRREGREEALRLHQVRTLHVPGDRPERDGRAVISSLSRRRRAGSRRVWLFNVSIAAASGGLVWESLLPFHAGVPPALAVRNAASMRRALDPALPALQDVLHPACHDLLLDLAAALAGPLRRWTRRELDLMAAVRARHGRLAAGLVQRGLFDRRDERLAASRVALLDRALSRSAARLADLAGAGDLRTDACDLVFALILE